MGWLTVLQLVPWTEVIKNAPKVAEGAKKLWKTVGKSPVPGAPPGSPVPATTTGEPPSLAALHERLLGLERATADLHAQMLSSSALISELAEQNSRLIEGLEVARRRLRWLSVGVLVALGGLGILGVMAV